VVNILKNRMGAELAFAQIIAILIVLALLVWALFYFGGLREKIAEVASRFLG